MRSFLIFTFVMLFNGFVNAGYPTADQMLIDCVNANSNLIEDAVGNTYCSGYIDGIIDGHEIVSVDRPEARQFCMPKEGISVEQAVNTVILYIKNHPELKQTTGRVVVLKAFQDKFPCKL